jgi:hypothetical protein
MFQLAIHFTFYHELAHLIQRSDSQNESEVSLSSCERQYSERSHIEELDADAFSSICLASHVVQLFENNYPNGSSIEVFEELITVMCATGINYILSFGSMSLPFYLYESSHPHAVIRITEILGHILEYTQQYFGTLQFSNEVRKRITINAFELSQEIFGDVLVQSYFEIYTKNFKEINHYLEYFRKLSEGDPTLAIYKWNLNVG